MEGGKQLIWDVTCPNTLAPSYKLSVKDPGVVANEAEKKKKNR